MILQCFALYIYVIINTTYIQGINYVIYIYYSSVQKLY